MIAYIRQGTMTPSGTAICLVDLVEFLERWLSNDFVRLSWKSYHDDVDAVCVFTFRDCRCKGLLGTEKNNQHSSELPTEYSHTRSAPNTALHKSRLDTSSKWRSKTTYLSDLPTPAFLSAPHPLRRNYKAPKQGILPKRLATCLVPRRTACQTRRPCPLVRRMPLWYSSQDTKSSLLSRASVHCMPLWQRSKVR
jgi:hypothetical protein